jgi:hypothetical protein
LKLNMYRAMFLQPPIVSQEIQVSAKFPQPNPQICVRSIRIHKLCKCGLQEYINFATVGMHTHYSSTLNVVIQDPSIWFSVKMEGKWYVLANLSKTRHNLKTWLSWCMVKTSDNYLILPWDNIEHVYSTHKNKWERIFFFFLFPPLNSCGLTCSSCVWIILASHQKTKKWICTKLRLGITATVVKWGPKASWMIKTHLVLEAQVHGIRNIRILL